MMRQSKALSAMPARSAAHRRSRSANESTGKPPSMLHTHSWNDSMDPIISNDQIQILGPHPDEAALLARPSRRVATGTVSPAAVPRHARKRALLGTRLMDINMIRTMETL